MKRTGIFFVGLILLISCTWLAVALTHPRDVDKRDETTAQGYVQYTDPDFGLTFQYPDGYVVKKRERETVLGAYQSIVLIRDDTQDEGSQAERERAMEEPPTLSLHRYALREENQTVSEWLSDYPESHFNLRIGATSTVHVGGETAIEYTHDGLYETRVIALRHKDAILAFAIPHKDLDQKMVQDFEFLIKSVELIP